MMDAKRKLSLETRKHVGQWKDTGEPPSTPRNDSLLDSTWGSGSGRQAGKRANQMGLCVCVFWVPVDVGGLI